MCIQSVIFKQKKGRSEPIMSKCCLCVWSSGARFPFSLSEKQGEPSPTASMEPTGLFPVQLF